MKEDNINNPSHYKGENGIECIDAMVAAFGKEAVTMFCKCNAFKYLFRSKEKQREDSIKKADWYITKYMELSMNEEWRPCVETNIIEVSNRGNVRYAFSDKDIIPLYSQEGYPYIIVMIGGALCIYYIHELVAKAFLPTSNKNGLVVHKNNNRSDNRVENLKWCNDSKKNVYYLYDDKNRLIDTFSTMEDLEDKYQLDTKVYKLNSNLKVLSNKIGSKNSADIKDIKIQISEILERLDKLDEEEN